MRAALFVALALSSTALTAQAATRATACDAQIRRQAAGGLAAEPSCWRIGPVAIGMRAEEVAALIGPPDHEAPGPASGLREKVDRTGYRNAFYVFPRDLAQRLARAPAVDVRMRILKIAYFQDRVVEIETAPPSRGDADRCNGTPHGKTTQDRSAPGFVPFRSFAGVREGDSIATLEARFGKRHMRNRPGDFFNYAPVPLTLGVDTERGAVGSFSIGADEGAVMLGGWANLHYTRDPATCRVTGFRFEPDDGVP